MPANLDPKTPQGRGEIEENIRRSNKLALEIAKLGHIPFTPHTMMRGWEDEYGFPREELTRICLAWLRRCDALLFISSSPGADQEKLAAEQLDLPVYFKISDVPAKDPARAADE
jgi:hypothetical protein